MRSTHLTSLSRTHARLVALLIAGALSLPLLGGCGTAGTTDSGSSDSSTAESASTDASSTSGDSSTSTDDASSSTDSDSSSDSSTSTPTFDFSKSLDDDGHWTDVTALDLVTLPADYASIKAPSDEVVPSDETVQSQIDTITQGYATTEQVTDRAVKDGDTVNIDYVGSIDGEEFSGGSTEGNGTTVTIGTTQYIDDFLEQLIGHKPGETFDIEVTFPDDYGVEDLNGKDATFSVTINYISETTQPDVTDDWVKENLESTYGWTTVDEMKQSIKSSLQSSNLSTYVTNYVTENSTLEGDLPEELVSYQEQLLIYQYERYAASFGIDLDKMLQMAAGVSSTNELLENQRDALDSTAKSYLVFQAIVEEQGFTASDDDVTDYIESQTGSTDVSTYEEQYGMPYLKLLVLMQKVGNFLTENATIE